MIEVRVEKDDFQLSEKVMEESYFSTKYKILFKKKRMRSMLVHDLD